MPVTHGVASSSLVQTAKRVDELFSSALFCKIEYLDSLDRINTKRQYQYLQNRFLPLLPDNVSFKELTYEDLQTAVFQLRKQGLKDSSISVMIRALKSLCNNQYKKGLAPVPPRFESRPKRKKTLEISRVFLCI